MKIEKKIPIASTSTTPGLVSALQMIDATPNEIFATVRNDTSELEIQRITYFPKLFEEIFEPDEMTPYSVPKTTAGGVFYIPMSIPIVREEWK